MLALMEGRLADAEQLISDTMALGRLSQSWNAVVSERFALFVLRRAQGRLAEYEDTIKRSVHEYPPLLRFRCALAHTYSELGRKHTSDNPRRHRTHCCLRYVAVTTPAWALQA